MPDLKSDDPKFEIVTLKSGIKSLRLIENQEIFHPGIGPVAEANILHVQQQDLPNRCLEFYKNSTGNNAKYIIWDVGLGAAANAVAAIEALKNSPAQIEIHSFDQTLEPIEFALNNAKDLDYLIAYSKSIGSLLSGHASGQAVKITDRLSWFLHLGDFRESLKNVDLPSPHTLFYDPYSPTENLEMWTLEHFTNLKNRLDDQTPCLMTNYSRSTVVRVTWLMAGFYVGIGSLIGQKEETTVASNVPELIKNPIDKKWLERVKISHSASPLRGSTYKKSPIEIGDFEILKNSRQFNES